MLLWHIGDDTEEDKEALKKLADSKKKTEKKKKEVVNKSMLVIEIKPNSSETNLDDIAAEVKKIKLEGLTWGESVKKVPIAFGLYKLQVWLTVIHHSFPLSVLLFSYYSYNCYYAC